ncbi:hypothetical protein PPUN12996_12450 [Pseudomonas putida]|nr:hypothetical protein PPUN12996_12450 [Pseudomonas putida]
MLLRTYRKYQAWLRQLHELTTFVTEGQATRTKQVRVAGTLLPMKAGRSTKTTVVEGGRMQVEVLEQCR